jgi:bifunctional enzyme CysN/CysC
MIKPLVTIDETRQFLAQHQVKELLRLMTCGSVDDGKSTLIGRLLLETGSVYDDQLAALQRDTEKHGTTDLPFDPALLLDGLEDERQQGITIDVAYRYFQTPQRKFIIADSPGHEQYTRNMATAASTAQLAIILVDARKGLLTQTRRHSFIVSLLGVRHVILAVNKMDLVDYDQTVFEQICLAYRDFAGQLEIPDIRFLPLSGLRGDNVAQRSHNMPWYDGAPLLQLLEDVQIGTNGASAELRFPVQRVNRPDSNFRGYSGTLVSGSVRVGDEVLVLPGRKATRVRSIVTFDGELPQANAGAAVTLTLEDELDVAQGDMIVHLNHLPRVGRHWEATLVWMSEQPLAPGKSYWLKQTTRRTSAEVQVVSHRFDVNTLQRLDASTLKMNEIGQCQISSHDPVVYDPYRHNRRTGAFVLVDRVTHETVAAGMIHDPLSETQRADAWSGELRSSRLQFTTSRISAEQRFERYGHPAMTILLTGLSGSGKTTIAYALEERLFLAGRAVMVLDGQNLRHGISRDLGFSADERSENLRRAAEIARLFNDAGIICIAAFVAPDAAIRDKARHVIGADRLLHIHLAAPLEVCRQRDQSGRYAAAERGEIVNFPGLTAPYAQPVDADLVIPTDRWSVAECLDAIERPIVERLDRKPEVHQSQ